mgnify:CR=1 FL=1
MDAILGQRFPTGGWCRSVPVGRGRSVIEEVGVHEQTAVVRNILPATQKLLSSQTRTGS